nr:ribonuclease H-like domain-containing protein [Tanacetum cinerariifolium]
SERPKFSKPRFSSQVDVNNVLSKPITPHYFPKVRESVFVKSNHVIASGSSRNSTIESYGSNDMAHNYYLDEAKKKTQNKIRNLKPSVMHTTSLQNITNGRKPKPRSNNQTSRSLPIPKSSRGMLNGVTLVDHSRNSGSFSDSKHFVCLTCQKSVINANHDDCITKVPKEVNSHAKVPSPKFRKNIKPAKRIPNVNKSKRWISKRYRFSPNKSFVVHEKPNTPRSCIRWKPMGRIFKTAGLRWIPTGKMFTDCTTKVDSEPLNVLNGDITNPYECDQTLNVSASTLNLSAGLLPQSLSLTANLPPTKNDWDTVCCLLFDEYFNPPPCDVSLISAAVAALKAVDPAGSPSLYTSSILNAACKKYLDLLKKGSMVRRKLRQLPSGEYQDGLQTANMNKMIVSLSSQRDIPRDNPLVSVEVLSMNTACDQVEFQRISLTGFRRCASHSQIGASQSRQSMETWPLFLPQRTAAMKMAILYVLPLLALPFPLIDEDDMEEIDIKWNMTLLSMRTDKFWKRTRKKISIQGSDVVGFNKSKVECFNCHKIGHFARKCRAPRSQEKGRKESYRQGSKAKEKSSKALMAIDGV